MDCRVATLLAMTGGGVAWSSQFLPAVTMAHKPGSSFCRAMFWKESVAPDRGRGDAR